MKVITQKWLREYIPHLMMSTWWWRVERWRLHNHHHHHVTRLLLTFSSAVRTLLVSSPSVCTTFSPPPPPPSSSFSSSLSWMNFRKLGKARDWLVSLRCWCGSHSGWGSDTERIRWPLPLLQLLLLLDVARRRCSLQTNRQTNRSVQIGPRTDCRAACGSMHTF